MKKGSRILVVEDEMVISIEISHTLKRLGYTVVGQAITGIDAIRLARELLPDLILMDIRLIGEIDGIEAAARIKEEINRPIIFLSAHSDDITLERAIAVSPSGYLIKPFKDRELYSTIELALHKHNLWQRIRPERAEHAYSDGDLYDIPGVCLLHVSLKGVINHVNHEACILLGADSTHICGTTITRWIDRNRSTPDFLSFFIIPPGSTQLHTQTGETIAIRIEVGFVTAEDGLIHEYLLALYQGESSGDQIS